MGRETAGGWGIQPLSYVRALSVATWGRTFGPSFLLLCSAFATRSSCFRGIGLQNKPIQSRQFSSYTGLKRRSEKEQGERNRNREVGSDAGFRG